MGRSKLQANRLYLRNKGIKIKKLQDIAISKIPCGEESIQAVVDDTTSIEANSPRVIMIMWYKGLLAGLIQGEKVFTGR